MVQFTTTDCSLAGILPLQLIFWVSIFSVHSPMVVPEEAKLDGILIHVPLRYEHVPESVYTCILVFQTSVRHSWLATQNVEPLWLPQVLRGSFF